MSKGKERVIASIAAWNEEDEEKRRRCWPGSWAEEGISVDPRVEVGGRDALVQQRCAVSILARSMPMAI